jgi:glycerol uptake facilitator-like aquaporin
MRKWRVKGFKRIAPEVIGAFIESVLLIAISGNAFAQTADGTAGISQATSTIAGYFDAGCNLMYAIGAILGLIGAVKVYQKWNHGDHDTSKVAAAWFGSCIFLVIVATVLKAFFGVS